MAEVGDKSFAKQLVNSIEAVVSQNVGNASAIDRYQAKVVSVDTTNHTASVQIGGSTDTSAGFKVRGMQFPSANDLVMVCIDGGDRWVESVVRPVGTGAYPSVTLDWTNNEVDVSGTIKQNGSTLPPTGSIVMWATATPPTGWLFLDGSTVNQADYPTLALVFGVTSGTLTLPDMRDRFVGGRSDTALGWANNTGTSGPNAPHSHTTNIAHGHADTFSVGSHASHTHTVDPAAVTSGYAASDTSSTGDTFAYVASGATYRAHRHSVDVAATVSGGPSATLSHTVSGAVTSLGATSVTSSENAPKSTLLNFIIKT